MTKINFSLLFVMKDSALNRGMNTGIENLAWGLAERGCDVHILAGGKKPDQHDYELPDNVRYHFTNGTGYPFDHVNDYLKLRNSYDFDAVIGWVRNISPIANLEKKLSGNTPKFIANEGQLGGEVTAYRRLRYFILTLLREKKVNFSILFKKVNFQNIDYLVPITEAVKSSQSEIYNIQSEQSKIIPRGVDTENFKPSYQKKDFWNNEYINILFTGNILEGKGLGDVVEALRYVEKPVKLTLCGKDRGYLEKLNNSLKETGNKHTINYLGILSANEIVSELHKANIFVFCSWPWHEGLGKSLLEAMACELPVIVSDIEAFRNVVDNELNGLVVETGNPKEISKSINQYIQNPKLREKCKLNARKTIIEKFSKDNEIDQWLRVITNVTMGK